MTLRTGDTVYCKSDASGDYFFKGNRLVKDHVPDAQGDIKIFLVNGDDWFFCPYSAIDDCFKSHEDRSPTLPVTAPVEFEFDDSVPWETEALPDSKPMSAYIEQDTQATEVSMSNSCGQAATQRRTLELVLIDDDAGLEDENSVVGTYSVVTGESEAIAINQLVSEGQVSKDIAAHNKVRAGIQNRDILNRTGNTVNLLPIKLKDLRFQVK